MSLGQCIPGMVERGEITPEKGREMADLYGGLEQEFRRQFGNQAAAAMATDAALKQLAADALRKKRIALGQVQAQKRLLKDMGTYAGGDGNGPIDPRAAVAAIGPDPARARYSNVEGRRRAVRARAFSMLDSVLATHHTNAIGQVRGKAQLHQLVRELFGEDSGNAAARELADAWEKTSEMLRRRFNAAGGAIGKLEKWGLPQAHDTRAVRAAGYETWRDEILPRLAPERMIDQRTGMAFSPQGLELALRDVFETIRTDGWNKRTAGATGRGALANQRGDSRFLIFKSADDWMDYQERFGVGTAFDAMTGHVDGMARDIAMMEVLGPNPSATVKWLKDTIERSAALDTTPNSKATDRAHAAVKKIDRYWDEITGAAGRPENRTLALAFSTVRSLQTSAKLGSAMVSAAPTDPMFGIMARKFSGLPVSGMIRDYVKLFRPGAAEDQQLALRLSGIAEEWSKRVGGQQRMLGEEITNRVAGRLAEGALRITGLNRYTEAGRWAMGMTIVGHVTGERGKRFAELDAPFRRSLERYGINEAGWDSIRATPLERDRGADWLKPVNIEDHELGDRLFEMIQSEMDAAVPTPDIRTRAMLNSIAPSGTIPGELIRSTLLFKSFGINMIIQQTQRIMEAAMVGRWNAARYAGGLFIATTIGGLLSLEFKALKDGKDLRPITDVPHFETDDEGNRSFNGGVWAAAMAQGGGFGLAGDFVQSSQNRFGGGIVGTIAGPIAQDVQGLANVATSKNPAWAAAKLARQSLPGGSTWYARLAFDRMVTDQLQEQLDPNYRQSWDRMGKRAAEQRTQFYWAPGETAPGRAPDFANAWNTEDPEP